MAHEKQMTQRSRPCPASPPNLVASTADLSERDIKENPVVKEEETNDTEVSRKWLMEKCRRQTQIIDIAAAWVTARHWIVHGTTGPGENQTRALGISGGLALQRRHHIVTAIMRTYLRHLQEAATFLFEHLCFGRFSRAR